MTRYVGMLCCLMLLAVPPSLQAQGTPRGLIRGVVTDSAKVPIADAEVVLHDSRVRARTREDGRFELPPQLPGVYIVTARRLGFAPASFSVRLVDSAAVTLRMQRTPAILPEVMVNGEQKRMPAKLVGFYDRMRTSGAPRSSYITRDDIEKRNPWRTSDLIRDQGTRATSCLSGMIYVDGVPSAPGSMFDPPRGARRSVPDSRTPVDAFPPADIEAIEIYRGPGTAPSEFNATAPNGQPPGCVILIWTR